MQTKAIRRFIVTIVACGLVLLGQSLRAGESVPSIRQYVVEKWQTDRHPALRTVRSMLQTPDGFLWIATQNGILRFDGRFFQLHSPATRKELRTENFLMLLPSARGGFWAVGLNGQLYRRWREQWLDYSSLLPESMFMSVYAMEDNDGGIWICTNENGLIHVPAELTRPPAEKAAATRGALPACRIYTTRDGLGSNKINCLLRDSRGRLLVGTTNAGIYFLKDGRFLPLAVPPDVMPRSVTKLIEDRDGVIWVGTPRQGVYWLRGERLEPLSAKAGLTHPFVSAFCLDRHGILWVGNRGGGLSRREGDTFTRLTLSTELLNAKVTNLYGDRDGGIWVGTYDSGLFRVREGRFVNYTESDGWFDGLISAVLQDRRGAMWIGTENSGLVRLENGRFTAYTSRQGLPVNSILSLAEDDRGLWIGTINGGLARLGGGRMQRYTRRDGLVGEIVYCLAADGRGGVWIGSEAGLSHFDGRSFRHFPPPGDKPGRGVFSLHLFPDGGLLLGMASRRLLLFRDRVFTALPLPEECDAERIECITVDPDGTWWLGTYGAGVLVRRNDTWYTLDTGNGLPDNYIYAVLRDEAGNLWLNSKKGIVVLARAETTEFLAGRRSRLNPRVLDEQDGLSSELGMGLGQPSAWRDADGHMWFTNSRGVSMIDPGKTDFNEAFPPVYIEGFTIDDQSFSPYQSITVPPGKRKFAFAFSAPSLVKPERVRLQYYLEGFDTRWNDVGEARYAVFTNLGPGPYKFRVRVGNRAGDWSPQEAAISFTVKPAFRTTRLFHLLVVAVLAVLVFLGYRLRVLQIQRRSRRLEVLVDERTSELRQEKNRTEQALLEVEHAHAQLALAHHQLLAANQELEKVSQSKSDLLRIVAHDLRNPLQGILGYSEVIQRKYQSNDEVSGSMTTIVQAARQMKTLIEELLNTAAIESGKVEVKTTVLDLSEVVNYVLWQNRQAAERKRQQLNFSSEGNCRVRVDAVRIVEVVDNLVGNAVKFSPWDRRIWISVYGDDGRVRLIVRDEGPGLTAEDRLKVFDKFQRLSARPTGGETTVGLGLAITKQLVEMMDGSITVESQGVGLGTTFVVEFPAAEETPASASEKNGPVV